MATYKPERNEVFTYPRGFEITPKVLADFIQRHAQKITRYKRLEKLYYGEHDILYQESKAEYKPDNRLVVNFAKYIVDTFNGFFIGIPLRVTSDDADINAFVQNFRNRNSMDDVEAELSKMSSIYGHAFEYLYQNENAETESTYVNPMNAFIVYDNTIAQKPLFGVHYSILRDETGRDGELVGELVTNQYRAKLSGNKSEPRISDIRPHFYNGVPIIEYVENEERQSIYENVETLINSLNKVLSEKANDVDYFSDAYLKILGADLEEDDLKALRDNRIINLSGEDSEKIIVDFLEKPNADETQEHLIERLIDLIYQMSMVANINDDKFGQASGIALEFKLLPMRNLAMMKERKFKSSMAERYRMIFNLPLNVSASMKDEWINLNYRFTRNIPENLADEAQTAEKLWGLVSEETLLSTLSIVDDPKREIERKEEEDRIKDPYLNYPDIGQVEDEEQ